MDLSLSFSGFAWQYGSRGTNTCRYLAKRAPLVSFDHPKRGVSHQLCSFKSGFPLFPGYYINKRNKCLTQNEPHAAVASEKLRLSSAHMPQRQVPDASRHGSPLKVQSLYSSWINHDKSTFWSQSTVNHQFPLLNPWLWCHDRRFPPPTPRRWGTTRGSYRKARPGYWRWWHLMPSSKFSAGKWLPQALHNRYNICIYLIGCQLSNKTYV